MNFDHRARRILVTGKSGTGKTTEMVRLIRHIRPRWLFVFDPQREFSRKMGHDVCEDLVSMLDRVKARLPVFFDPHSMYPGESARACAFFCRWSFEVSKCLHGQKLLVVDEIQLYTDTLRGGIPSGLAMVMDTGRREELDTLFASQRPNNVNDRIRSQLTEIITFAHTDDLPLRWLEKDGFNREEVSALKIPGGKLVRIL